MVEQQQETQFRTLRRAAQVQWPHTLHRVSTPCPRQTLFFFGPLPPHRHFVFFLVRRDRSLCSTSTLLLPLLLLLLPTTDDYQCNYYKVRFSKSSVDKVLLFLLLLFSLSLSLCCRDDDVSRSGRPLVAHCRTSTPQGTAVRSDRSRRMDCVGLGHTPRDRELLRPRATRTRPFVLRRYVFANERDSHNDTGRELLRVLQKRDGRQRGQLSSQWSRCDESPHSASPVVWIVCLLVYDGYE